MSVPLADRSRRLVTGWVILLAANSFAAEPPSPRDVFKKLDRNGDGKLTLKEVPADARKNFVRCDVNRDGTVTLAEFVDAVRRVIDPEATADSVRKPTETVRALRDIPYADTAHVKQRLDLFLPKSPRSRSVPLVVFIHGGGWMAGDKEQGGPLLLNYVANGEFAGASIGYRFSTEAAWPAQIHDCKAAIRWLRTHAREHGIDPDRIGVWGGSAGGHLVSMLGTTGNDPALEGNLGSCGKAGSGVRCVVNYCGPSNLVTAAAAGAREGDVQVEELLAKLLGGPLATRLDVAREASPVSHISQQAPPFLIAHGTRDDVVPFDQSLKFHAALQREGVESLLIRVQGGGHNILDAPGLDERTKLFFERHLLDRSVTISDRPITLP